MRMMYVILYGMVALVALEIVWIVCFVVAQVVMSQKEAPALFRCTKCGETEYKPVRRIWLSAILVYILRCKKCRKNFYRSTGVSEDF